MKRKLKVALVCDWLTNIGGAEQVIKTIHEMYHTAPIFTSQYRPKKVNQFFTDGTKKAFPIDVYTGYLNYFPAFMRRFIAPLRQKYFSNLDLSKYDLVISITGSDAKAVTTNGVHICFCHVPTQYYWGKREAYLKNPGFGVLNPLVRVVYRNMLPKLQNYDIKASKMPDYYITISNYAKTEIKKFYNKKSTIINPPVNTKIYRQAFKNREKGLSFAHLVENYDTKKGKCQIKITTQNTIKSNKSQIHQKTINNIKMTKKQIKDNEQIIYNFDNFVKKSYVNFSRQVSWKNLDVAVEAFAKLNKNLILIGDGPEHKKIIKLAKEKAKVFKNLSDFVSYINNSPKPSPQIYFLLAQPQSTLAYFATLAKAFIFTSEEPFGIAPVEAIAAGCPVIALKRGGAMDYIKENKNGIFYDVKNIDSTDEQINSLIRAVRKFEKDFKSSRQTISKTAAIYDESMFVKKLNKFINAKVNNSYENPTR